MYDIHSHILPALDDGAVDQKTALRMAHIAVEDGITHMACTPHIYPGLYDYDSNRIDRAIADFSEVLKTNHISLTLGNGADIQMVSEMVARLNDKTMPTINNSRYLLCEPPHHVAPFHFIESVTDILSAGYVPIITHPERLSWLQEHYDDFLVIAEQGAWMQVTAGSLTGAFGSRPQYWAEKMLADGVVHILATDAHNTDNRAPVLRHGTDRAVRFIGKAQAEALVNERPKAVWDNRAPDMVSQPPGFDHDGKLPKARKKGLLKRLFSK